MSGIASLYNVPGTQQELDNWSFSHTVSHRDIIAAIYTQSGESLQEFSLDPIPLDNIQSWTYQHQQMHNDMNRILGIDSLNLVSVDWQDPLSRASWILSNASEHRQAYEILRIGQPTQPSTVTSTFRSNAQSSASLTTYSFAGMAFGTASSDRYVVVCVAWYQSAARTLSSVTIGGNAATILTQNTNTVPGVSRGSAICLALVQAGTSGTVSVTLNAGCATCSVAVYSLTGITSPSASQVASSSANAPSASLTVNQNGAIIAVATTGSLAGASGSWSGGLTTDTNNSYFTGNQISRSSGSGNFPEQHIGLSVACSFSGTGVGLSSGSFAVFNPPSS